MTGRCEALSERDASFVQRTLRQKPREIRVVDSEDGGARVVRITLENGGRVFLKRHRSQDRGLRELAAYQALHEDALVSTLLGTDTGTEPALLLAALPGATRHHDAPTAVHAAAGAWLAGLHSRKPVPEDVMPLPDAYRLRIERALRDAKGILPARDLDVVSGRLAELPSRLIHESRCWTHRDYVPRNWRQDGDALVGVLDFEHARPDCAATDFARIHTEVWVTHPSAAEPFLEGYQGAGGTLPDQALRDDLALLDALVTYLWGHRHAQKARRERGERALQVHLASN